MATAKRMTRIFLAALAIGLIAPGLASAQDADTQEVLRYALTDAGLAKYTLATQKLVAVSNASGDCEDDDSDAQSLNAMAAKLNANPAAKAAVQSAGMTAREFAVFTMSLVHNGLAAWSVSQPGGNLPPGVSKANVDFLKRNDAKLKALEGIRQQEECGDQAAEEEEIEEVVADEG